MAPVALGEVAPIDQAGDGVEGGLVLEEFGLVPQLDERLLGDGAQVDHLGHVRQGDDRTESPPVGALVGQDLHEVGGALVSRLDADAGRAVDHAAAALPRTPGSPPWWVQRAGPSRCRVQQREHPDGDGVNRVTCRSLFTMTMPWLSELWMFSRSMLRTWRSSPRTVSSWFRVPSSSLVACSSSFEACSSSLEPAAPRTRPGAPPTRPPVPRSRPGARRVTPQGVLADEELVLEPAEPRSKSCPRSGEGGPARSRSGSNTRIMNDESPTGPAATR